MIVTVTRYWDDSHGPCYDCGDPAAFIAPNLYYNRMKHLSRPPLNANNLFCAVCAAQHACDGERIFRLWVDDADPPVSEEHRLILAELGILKPDESTTPQKEATP